MLTITEAARENLRSQIAQAEEETLAVRISYVRGCTPLSSKCELSLVEHWDRTLDDLVLDGGGFEVVIDRRSVPILEDAIIDYVERHDERGFEIRNTHIRCEDATFSEHETVPERVERALREFVNPSLGVHGGRVTLIDCKDNVAYVAMSGGCQGCGLAKVTLHSGVEKWIRMAVPEIRGVVDVTDHSAGVRPYFPTQT